ncbi:MAG: 30S ribosomal protein S3 [archaeon]
MIEKVIVKKNVREYIIQEYIANKLPKACYSKIELRKTPLGEKIIIHTSRPGLVVGRKGSNIQILSETLKNIFGIENPQIEVAEIENPNLDPKSVAEYIVSSFEKFGPKRFKSLGYGALQNIMDAGAQGAEIVITGRGVPSSRSKRWRFSAGHLKKSGNVSENLIKRALVVAELKSGAIGVKVNILTPDIQLPDVIKPKIDIKEIKQEVKETKKIEVKEEIKEPEEEKKDVKEVNKEKKEKKNDKKTRTKTDES